MIRERYRMVVRYLERTLFQADLASGRGRLARASPDWQRCLLSSTTNASLLATKMPLNVRDSADVALRFTCRSKRTNPANSVFQRRAGAIPAARSGLEPWAKAEKGSGRNLSL